MYQVVRRSVLLLILLLHLIASAPGQAQERSLPPPLPHGGFCPGIVPCTDSGPFGLNLRLGAVLHEDPGAPTIAVGGFFSLSASVLHWAELGMSFYGSQAQRSGLATSPTASPPVLTSYGLGPLSIWARLSPPFLSGMFSEKKERGLSLAAWVESDAAGVHFDEGGTLYPDTETYGAVVDGQLLRLRASLYGAYQSADAGHYSGVEAGASVWLMIIRAAGLQVGAEVLTRAGQHDGQRAASDLWAVLGVRIFDEGGRQLSTAYVRSVGGQSAPSSAGMLSWGMSFGPGYKHDPPRGREACDYLCRAGLWLRGFRDPVIGWDGCIYTDDYKERLACYGTAHPLDPRSIVPYRPGPVLHVGEHVQYRPSDSVVRTMDDAPIGTALRLDQAAALQRALARSRAQTQAPGWRHYVEPVMLVAGGALYGSAEALPGAGLLRYPLAPQGHYFELGRGAGQFATGIVEATTGTTLTVGGGGISGTGAGALVGVPASAAGVVLVGSGVVAVHGGLHRLLTLHREDDEEEPQAAERPEPPRQSGVTGRPASPPGQATAPAVNAASTRGGAGPVRQGQAGVNKWVKSQQAQGNHVDTEITFDTPAGRRRVDGIVTESNGNQYAAEVKTGKSRYTPAQQRKDQALSTQGGVPAGQNAQRAGFKKPVQLPTKLIRLP